MCWTRTTSDQKTSESRYEETASPGKPVHETMTPRAAPSPRTDAPAEHRKQVEPAE